MKGARTQLTLIRKIT